jgi:hypothetical protein
MRKTVLLAAMVAIAALMMAATPAFADANENRDDFFCDWFDFNCHDNNNNDNNFVPELNQDFEQEADSGDIDQSFDVTGGGDNSNQCVGIQGVANTGNAQDQLGITQLGSDVDNNNDNNWWNNNWWNNHNNGDNFSDFDFEDSGASLEVSPTNTTSCDQQVNQAASAFGS